MKKITAVLVYVILLLIFSGCSAKQNYNAEDYIGKTSSLMFMLFIKFSLKILITNSDHYYDIMIFKNLMCFWCRVTYIQAF